MDATNERESLFVTCTFVTGIIYRIVGLSIRVLADTVGI